MLDWHDFVRGVGFCVSIFCVAVLLIRWRQKSAGWNEKTKDYWYALLMWSLAGCVFTVQGIVLDRPFTPGFVFLIAAILVTGKGLHQKGDWGEKSA
jgi:hypothetical protein